MAIKLRTRHLFAILCWVSMMALSAMASAQAQEPTLIELRQAASVSGQMVLLKDIADIRTHNPELIEKLGQIEIVRAPMVGQTRWVMIEQVERQFKQLGLDPRAYQWSATGPTKVERCTVSFGADKIRAVVERYIRSHAPWNQDQLKIRAIKFNRDLDVPPGKISLLVQTPKHSDWLGAVLFSVDVKVNGHVSQRVSVPVNIEVWSDVVLAAKPLGKYQPITAQGIQVVKMNLASVPANAILNADEVIGQRTRSNIAVNSVLRSDQVEMPPLVKRGDMVQAIAASAAMKISVQAMVKENGVKGEMIRVLNLRSKKIIYAQVVDAQTVSVEF
jgi:flagellar basal body P-ring formation protein FlgA